MSKHDPPPPPNPKHAWEPFQPAFARDICEHLMGPINESWFRTKIFGKERIPEHGPVILAGNHSGNAFPYDAIAFDSLLWKLDGYSRDAKLRTVYEKELSFVWWMRPFGLDDFWRRGGGVDMLFDNFDILLKRKERVLYFPEGVPGIGKGFHRRYQLQRFSTSFVLLGARNRAPVLPVYMINAEWINPFGFPFKPLDRFMQRFFTVPFLPLPIGIFAIIFPWMWYLALPANLIFVVGEPIDMAALVRDEDCGDLDEPDREKLRNVAVKVRHRMQEELTELVKLHGRKPYRVDTLWSKLKAARGQFWKIVPLGWPLAFVRHERDARRAPPKSRLHAFLRDLDLIGYYLPFGWPILSLSRAWRKPPYGYRGIPKERAREIRGEFIWRLKDRPLPPRASR
jgi:1-acyl-sn-glycerol-3-phosphate acyltransferase